MKGNMNHPPLISDIVLVGGGHAHVHALKMFGMPPLKNILHENGIQVTLISSSALTPYSGMLPGFIAGHYTRDDIHLDLRKLCSFSGIRFIHAAANGITYEEGGGGFVSCSDERPDIRYDAISIDIGSSPSMPSSLLNQDSAVFTETIDQNVTPVKPIASFSERWEGICDTVRSIPLENLNGKAKFRLLVVGGGAGGIELALSAQYALQNIVKHRLENNHIDAAECEEVSKSFIKVSLATRGDSLLPSHNDSVRAIFERILQERNIDVYMGADAVGVDYVGGEKSLKLSPESKSLDKPILYDECLWCTSAGVSSWLESSTPFETVNGGFLSVRDTYESTSHPGVFAAGDCCHMVSNPRPKAGVFAVRAGPIVTENIISYLLCKPMTSHTPQKEFLGLISTGDKYAVASRGPHALEGDFLWRLKDEIDVGWMSMYKVLPSMEDDSIDVTVNTQKIPSILQNKSKENLLAAFMEAPMRCGGCGSKVGSHTLTRVLEAIYKRKVCKAIKQGSNVKELKKIDPDDAAIIMLPTSGGAMVQTVDFFRSFISDPFVFGKIAAVHALSDCHAMGADAHTALALAVINFSANESITESTLIHMLSGANDIFENENCNLSGGHTCEGSEQALGFSITGFVQNPSHLLRKRGGKIGDKIILTKPIGTGALFAAEMRAKCHGENVQEALESMMISNCVASRIARQFIGKGVHACTDVTGFGLAGHLLEMLIANDTVNEDLDSIAAIIDLSLVPFFKGAIEAASNGIFSSLFRENFRSRRAVQNHEEAVVSSPIKYPLIFDPQTAGGLLLFVSPNVCEELLSCLRQNGNINSASIIGELTAYEHTNQSINCELNGSCTPTNERIIIKV